VQRFHLQSGSHSDSYVVLTSAVAAAAAVQSSTDSAEGSGEARGEKTLEGQHAVYVNQILQILPGKLSFVLFESEALVQERERDNDRGREKEGEKEGGRERGGERESEAQVHER